MYRVVVYIDRDPIYDYGFEDKVEALEFANSVWAEVQEEEDYE